VGKGYAEGPAAEEAERRRAELAEESSPPALRERDAVYGSTAEDAQRHFLGWADDIDADALFDSGQAWGLTLVRLRVGA
jgi:hypothetical protein